MMAATTALLMASVSSVVAATDPGDPIRPSPIAYARNVGDTIWMVEADGGRSEQLTTHRSGDPAWSPDGTRIAFTRYDGPTYDGVWIMDADGRGPKRLTTGFTGGPAWSPNGTHLAYTGPRGIGVVNADTGASQQLTINSDRNPAWSPDGAKIMFSRFQRGVWVMNTDSTGQELIAIEARHPVWSPGSVRVAYVNHHFEGIHVMGAGGVYKRRLTTDGGVFPQWSPDGTRIAYIGESGDEIWTIDAQGANRKHLVAFGWDPAWSPESTRIAYTRQDGIWITDSLGLHHRRLTNHGEDPVWSPDGTKILYTSNHLDGIWITDSDGLHPRQIATGGFGPVWSPDGGRLAYTRQDGIWITDSDGGNPLQLSPEYTEGPVWSPDGTQIAHTTRFGGIHLVDASSANHRQLTDFGSHPVWSPDGAQLAYATTEDHPLWASGPNSSIYVIEANGGNPWVLAFDGADPAWSPDGTQIAYTTRAGEIRVVKPDGREHLSTSRFGADPVWSVNGERLAYVGSGGGIFSMKADGGDHRTVTLQEGVHPRWSPDGTQIAYHTHRGLALINADGSDPLHLAESGATPAWRPSLLRSQAAAHPPSGGPSCPDDRRWPIPRFLPLSVRVTSQTPENVSGPFEITVEFSRPITGFLAEEILVVNGEVTALVDCDWLFRAQISPASVGAVVVRIPRNIARDITGQPNLSSTPLVRTGISQTSVSLGGFNTWDRLAVLRSYREEFGASPPAMGYTGLIPDCIAGTTSPRFRAQVIGRVNWYRQMAGLPEVKERLDYSELAQQAALMMAAEGALSHRPGPRWACHSALGATAAGQSNLLLGAVGVEAVDGYMRNQGPGNRSVGHRRLLLHPPLLEIGTGDVLGLGNGRSANALYIPGENLWDSPPDIRQSRGFVAWPPPGYVPAETVGGRWSFSVSGADFSGASVSVTNDRGPVTVEILSRDSSFAGSRSVPDSSMVWEVTGDADSTPVAGPRQGDLCLTVAVTGVRVEGRVQTPYEYATCIIHS